MSNIRAAFLSLPLLGLLTACGAADAPKDGQTVAQLFSAPARAETAPTPSDSSATARVRPRVRDKVILPGATASPEGSAATLPCPAQNAVQTPSNDAAARGGPKGGGRDKWDTGRAAGALPGPIEDAAGAERRGGPKGALGSDHQGRTVAPEAASPCPVPQVSPSADASTPSASGRPRGPKGGGRDKVLTN